MRLVYRELGRYKYLLLLPYELRLAPGERSEITKVKIDHDYINICDGYMVIKSGYAWDGASGPALDTKDFMKASLVHDAFYQLMRIGLLDSKIWKSFADKLLYQICLEEGMPKWRAWYVYMAVKLFGPKYKGTEGEKPERTVIE